MLRSRFCWCGTYGREYRPYDYGTAHGNRHELLDARLVAYDLSRLQATPGSGHPEARPVRAVDLFEHVVVGKCLRWAREYASHRDTVSGAVTTASEGMTVGVPKVATRERFRNLARTWKAERGVTSSATEMAMHPAYQEIIGMGQDALPFLLQEFTGDPFILLLRSEPALLPPLSFSMSRCFGTFIVCPYN